MDTDRLIYFGDSLTDTGAGAGALDAALGPGSAAADVRIGPEGAISNSFAHPTYAGEASGLDVESYAIGGARALGDQESVPGFDINFGAQITRFLADTAGADLSTTKAVFFIGINDIAKAIGDAVDDGLFALLGLPRELEDLTDDLRDVLVVGAERLAEAGVTQVSLVTQPLPSFFPEFDLLPDAVVDLFDDEMETYNDKLGGVAERIEDRGLEAEIIDLSSVAAAVTQDPSGFGIVAPRLAFLIPEDGVSGDDRDAGATSVAGGPFDDDQVAYWDTLHPAQAIHEVWGAATAAVMAGATVDAGDGGSDALGAASGGSILIGYGNEDTLTGAKGPDILLGSTGDDLVKGNKQADVLVGGSGDDSLNGGRGTDVIGGGRGDDVINGGRGRDLIVDGLGADFARGGIGRDTFVYVEPDLLQASGDAGVDTLAGGQGVDRLFLVVSETTAAAHDGDVDGLVEALGLVTRKIEKIKVVVERDGIADALDGTPGADLADLWGIV